MNEKVREFENEIIHLNDQELLDKLKSFFIKEKKIGDAILICLKEIKSRRLYNLLGYSSLFEMLIKYYSLSESGAFQRLNALKLIESVPEAQKLLINGNLSLNTLSEVQTYINKCENTSGLKMSTCEKSQLIEEIKDKSVRETRTLLAEKNPDLSLPVDKEKQISAQYTLVQMKLDPETMDLVNELKNLLSHQIGDGNWNSLIKTMAQTTILQTKKKKGLIVTDKNTIQNKSKVVSTNINTVTTRGTSRKSKTKTSKEISKSKSNSNKINIYTSAKDVAEIGSPNEGANLKMLTKNNFQQQNNINSESEIENAITTMATSATPRITSSLTELAIQNCRTLTSEKHCAIKRSRYIPRMIRRKVFERAGFQCQYVSPNGHRCEARHQLEVNHIKAFSKGGTHEPDQLEILCKSIIYFISKKHMVIFINQILKNNLKLHFLKK